MLQTLLLRFLPHLNVTEYNKQLRELWTAIFKGLAVIGRRDCHLLTDFYSEFRRWLNAVKDFDTVLRLARALSDSATHLVKNNSLTFALMNKVSQVIIMYNNHESFLINSMHVRAHAQIQTSYTQISDKLYYFTICFFSVWCICNSSNA